MKNIFSVRKILQALYYLQSNSVCEDKFNKMYLLKMMFFSDRYHLRHFGWVPSADNYVAMEYGPVASATYDILKKKYPSIANSSGYYDFDLLSNVEEKNENEVEIKPQQKDELSLSYVKALDFALEIYGKFQSMQLSFITHDYPEWKKHEEELKKVKSVPMNFTDFFEDPANLINSQKNGIVEDPFEDDRKFIEILKEDYIRHEHN